MNDPWFNPNLFAWIPGTVLGVTTGLWGGLCGVLVSRGRGRLFVWGTCGLLMLAGLACLIGAAAAIYFKQPYGVWFGLLLPGLQVPLLVGLLGLLVVRKGYREAELRKLQAADLE